MDSLSGLWQLRTGFAHRDRTLVRLVLCDGHAGADAGSEVDFANHQTAADFAIDARDPQAGC